MKNKLHLKNRRGATSLLVVVGLAMLLMVIVTGLTVLSVRESRQSLNTDLSNRALAAATASARDAAQLLNNDPALQVPDCDLTEDTITKSAATNLSPRDLEMPKLSNEPDNQTEIVCRTITSIASTFKQEVKRDKSTQFFTYLPNSQPVGTMKLQWGKSTEIDVYSGTIFKGEDNWSNMPAAMEVTLVYWPKGAGIGTFAAGLQPDGLQVRTAVLLPVRSGDANPGKLGNINVGVSCGNITASYPCESEINLGSLIGPGIIARDYNIVVKLKPRYAAELTPVRVEFYSGSTTEPAVAVQSSIATIDITAKVGDLYRRIQAQKPVGGNSFIDDVLYSRAKICKQLTVRQNFSLVGGNDCP